MHKEIKKTLHVLNDGGTILYPSDTIWGIGCDATNHNAVGKIFQLKNRVESKSMIVLVANELMLEKFTNFRYNLSHSDHPITYILPQATGLAKGLIANDGTAAFRIPKDEFCIRLITMFGKPIVSTSANKSGSSFPKQFAEIKEELIMGVDYVVNLKRTEIMNKPSEIIQILLNGESKKIR